MREHRPLLFNQAAVWKGHAYSRPARINENGFNARIGMRSRASRFIIDA